MFNLINLYNVFLDITTTIPPENVEGVIEEKAPYSPLERIIWYSLLVVMIAVVIVYTKLSKANKLSVSKIEKLIDNEIKKIEEVLSGKKEKNAVSISGVFHILNISKMEFIELRDKTSLPDMDEILKISDETMSLVRKGEVVKLSNENGVEKLNVVLTNLKTINEKLKIVGALVG